MCIRLAALLLVAVAALAGEVESRASSPPDDGGTARDAAGDAALATLERTFGLVPRAESLTRLDALARDHAASPAAARALVWRAQLAAVDGDDKGALDRYRRVLAKYPASPSAPLAWRGIGDLAFRARAFGDADTLYARALEHADPVLHAELVDKRALVVKWRARYRWFVAALVAFGAVALMLSVRIARGRGRLAFPVELWFAAPIVALLVASAAIFAREAFATVAIGGAGGVILFGLSGLAAERDPPRGRRDLVLGAASILVAAIALGWVAVYAGGLGDKLVDTIRGEAA